MDKVDIELIQDKETPGTIRYKQVPENGKPPKVKSIYLPKWVLGEPAPDKLHMTIEAV